MDVRRVQTGVAAVRPGPLRPRTQQPHPGAVGMVVHGPVCFEKGADIVRREELVRAVRPHGDAQRAAIFARRRGACQPGGRQVPDSLPRRPVRQVQRVARRQTAAVHAADAAQGESGCRAQHLRHVETAGKEQIGPHPLADRADGEHIRSRYGNRRPGRHGVGAATRLAAARQQHRGRRMELQRRPVQGDLQAGRAFVVAEQPIADAEGSVVHRPRWRHAHGPVALPPRIRLNRGVRTTGKNGHGTRPIRQRRQCIDARPARCEGRRRQRLAQVVAVGGDAVHRGLLERGTQRQASRFPVLRMDHDLRQQRIVEGRDFHARTQPGVDPHIGSPREGDHRGHARRRLEVPTRILGVESRLYGAAIRGKVRGQFVEGRQFPCRQPHHHAHEIDAEHQLGDAVLHLQPGIDLQEIGRPPGRRRRGTPPWPHCGSSVETAAAAPRAGCGSEPAPADSAPGIPPPLSDCDAAWSSRGRRESARRRGRRRMPALPHAAATARSAPGTSGRRRTGPWPAVAPPRSAERDRRRCRSGPCRCRRRRRSSSASPDSRSSRPGGGRRRHPRARRCPAARPPRRLGRGGGPRA